MKRLWSRIGILSIVFVFWGGFFLRVNLVYAHQLVLRVAHQFVSGDIRAQMARTFGNMVTKRTHGQIQFRYYPSSSLYKPLEMWHALRT